VWLRDTCATIVSAPASATCNLTGSNPGLAIANCVVTIAQVTTPGGVSLAELDGAEKFHGRYQLSASDVITWDGRAVTMSGTKQIALDVEYSSDSDLYDGRLYLQ